MSEKDLTSKEKELLWKAGKLLWKLNPVQVKIYKAIKKYANKGRKYVINSSRRLGKSYSLCVMAIEDALSKPRQQIKYAAPTAKMVRAIIQPIFRDILEDCPNELKPKWVTVDEKYKFYNGSEITVAGVDAGHAEALRGSALHRGYLDEAGFMDDLDYVYRDILLPQTLTTDGKMVLASTPPKTPAHSFASKFVPEAIIKGMYSKYTINDAYVKNSSGIWVRIPKSLIDEYAEESGGYESTTFRREYLAEIIKDSTTAVIPEFNDEMEKKIVVDTWERPKYYDYYISMDIGFEDLTVVLFGYYDFPNAKLIIENEIVLSRMTTEQLATEIKRVIRQKYNDKKPYRAVSDTDLIVINDLSQMHQLYFDPTDKDNKEAAINQARMLFTSDKVRILKNCEVTIKHLKNAVWNNTRKSFERLEGFGHFDAVDSFVYMVRNVDFNNNPFPVNMGLDVATHYYNPLEYLEKHENLKEITGFKIIQKVKKL